VDLKEERREIKVIPVYEVEIKAGWERGDRKTVACLFPANWRHLVAVTGCGELLLCETETGTPPSRARLDLGALKGASLSFVRGEQNGYVLVNAPGMPQKAFRIERVKN
jgi:hypothetical protein